MFTVNVKDTDYRFVFKRPAYNSGCTIAQMIRVEDKEVVNVAYTLCSVHDHFNKNTGRKRALTYLLSCTNFEKEDRKKVWDAYFQARHGKTI